MKEKTLFSTLFAALFAMGGAMAEDTPQNRAKEADPARYERATVGGGCFWCVESELKVVDGVVDTHVGYMGGELESPTYEQVSAGGTGHAEAVQITFDPARLSYETLLHAFFRAHDPTQLNRQGPDVGDQYRSVVFVHNDAQKAAAEKVIADINASGALDKPVVTTIEPAGKFWDAEAYHQDYYDRNPLIGKFRTWQKKLRLPWKD